MTPIAKPDRPGARPADAADQDVTIYIGGVHASRGPCVIKTLLGSCVAVCLHDPIAGAGGMNHFMLPRGAADDVEASPRFGVHAMDQLIGAIMKVGGDRRRLQAKVFGGAHVLHGSDAGLDVPKQNVDFVRGFLECEGFPVLSTDVGGYLPRHVVFHTATGRAFVKRVLSARARARLVGAEQNWKAEPPRYGDVMLFE